MRQTDQLTRWLKDTRFQDYLGRTTILKLEALAWTLQPAGRTLVSIARKHGAKRQLLSRYARQAASLYGENDVQVARRRQPHS